MTRRAFEELDMEQGIGCLVMIAAVLAGVVIWAAGAGLILLTKKFFGW